MCVCVRVSVLEGPVVGWKELLVVCLFKASVSWYPPPSLPHTAHSRSSIYISVEYWSVVICVCQDKKAEY